MSDYKNASAYTAYAASAAEAAAQAAAAAAATTTTTSHKGVPTMYSIYDGAFLIAAFDLLSDAIAAADAAHAAAAAAK